MIKKGELFLLALLLLQGCASDANKPSCFWKTLTMQPCSAQSLFSLDKTVLATRMKEFSPAQAALTLQEETPMVSQSLLYSYRLAENVREIRAQMDNSVLYLFYNQTKLLEAASSPAEKTAVYSRWDIASTNARDLELKQKYGHTITLSALQNALGSADESVYYHSSAYESPVYRWSYGPVDYFVNESRVIAQTNTPQERSAFLAKIAAKDPLEEEIVITQEQVHAGSVETDVNVWKANAPQLSKIFKNKTRQDILYSVEHVSSTDGTLVSTKGTEYAFVQYGSNEGDYRKFLFRAEEPQNFLAAAANVDDVLAVNKKYGINLGLNKPDFLKRYDGKTTQTNVQNQTTGTTQEVYQVLYSDVNTKTPQNRWFLFEEDRLSFTFETQADFDRYLTKIGNQNRALRKAEKDKQQKEQAAKQAAQKNNKTTDRQPIKALVSGGTVKDRSYMPVVTQPKDGKIVQPKMLE